MKDLAALRALCECVYQPNEARMEAVVGHDWSGLPRVRAALDAISPPVTQAALTDAAWRLVADAVDALEDRYPPVPGNITPLEVVRMHVLDRQPWLSIEAQLREERRPVSRGTLIRRQHEFLQTLRAWASTDSADGTPPADPTAVVDDAPRSQLSRGPRARLLLAVAIVGAVSVLIALALVPEDHTAEDALAPTGARSVALSPDRLGRQLEYTAPSGGVLQDPDPPLALPIVDDATMRVLPLRNPDGSVHLLVSYARPEHGDVGFARWDPANLEFVWKSSYDPPDSQRITHEGVGPEVFDESYWPQRMYHGGRDGDLGRYFAVTVYQKYSPTFVLFAEIDSGEVVGSYVHAGQIGMGIVVDLDGDGATELVLGGPDNVENRAVVLALRPGPWHGAASNVAWNTSGLDDALHRTFLPDWPEVRERLRAPRLHVADLSELGFDRWAHVLSVGVGVGGRTVYHVRLDSALRLVPDTPFVIWDGDRIFLDELELAAPDFADWAARVDYAPTR